MKSGASGNWLLSELPLLFEHSPLKCVITGVPSVTVNALARFTISARC